MPHDIQNCMQKLISKHNTFSSLWYQNFQAKRISSLFLTWKKTVIFAAWDYN